MPVLDILEHYLFSKTVFSDEDFTKKSESRKSLLKKLIIASMQKGPPSIKSVTDILQ